MASQNVHGKKALSIVFHGNSSITLQEVAPLAPIISVRYTMRRKILTFLLLTHYEFEMVEIKIGNTGNLKIANAALNHLQPWPDFLTWVNITLTVKLNLLCT